MLTLVSGLLSPGIAYFLFKYESLKKKNVKLKDILWFAWNLNFHYCPLQLAEICLASPNHNAQLLRNQKHSLSIRDCFIYAYLAAFKVNNCSLTHEFQNGFRFAKSYICNIVPLKKSDGTATGRNTLIGYHHKYSFSDQEGCSNAHFLQACKAKDGKINQPTFPHQ